MNSGLTQQFQVARRDESLAVIEGVQALKHAVRFGAEIEQIASSNVAGLEKLLDELAPDVKDAIMQQVEEVSEQTFAKLSPQPPRTKVITLTKRKKYMLKDLSTDKPVVFLEDPRDLENIGAAIRVAAAADIAGVLISGPADVWHPAVIRGAAGLHFAIPVLHMTLDELYRLGRELIALDPTGKEKFGKTNNAAFIFGTERHGISQSLLDKSDRIVRLPMKAGVSSLNLATSVAAMLYRLW